MGEPVARGGPPPALVAGGGRQRRGGPELGGAVEPAGEGLAVRQQLVQRLAQRSSPLRPDVDELCLHAVTGRPEAVLLEQLRRRPRRAIALGMAADEAV